MPALLGSRSFIAPPSRSAEVTAERTVSLQISRDRIYAPYELAQNPVERELKLRVIVPNAVANYSRPRVREDVRSRKLTTATGTGMVHGRLFVLRNWAWPKHRTPLKRVVTSTSSRAALIE